MLLQDSGLSQCELDLRLQKRHLIARFAGCCLLREVSVGQHLN